MIGQSQSGTGKTAAFVLTMLSRIDFSKNQPQVRLPWIQKARVETKDTLSALL